MAALIPAFHEVKRQTEMVEIIIQQEKGVVTHSFQPMHADEANCTVGNYFAFAVSQAAKFSKKFGPSHELWKNGPIMPASLIYMVIMNLYEETTQIWLEQIRGKTFSNFPEELVGEDFICENIMNNKIPKQKNLVRMYKNNSLLAVHILNRTLTPKKFPLYPNKVDRGIVEMIANLGHYDSKSNLKEAMNWWSISTLRNHLDSQLFLFTSYRGDKDTVHFRAKNHVLALRYLVMAADHNSVEAADNLNIADAQLYLARLYRGGNPNIPSNIIIPQDIAKFKDYLEKAVKRGAFKAIYMVACAHLEGRYYPKSIEIAINIYEKSLMAPEVKLFYQGTCYFFYPDYIDYEIAASYFKQTMNLTTVKINLADFTASKMEF